MSVPNKEWVGTDIFLQNEANLTHVVQDLHFDWVHPIPLNFWVGHTNIHVYLSSYVFTLSIDATVLQKVYTDTPNGSSFVTT